MACHVITAIALVLDGQEPSVRNVSVLINNGLAGTSIINAKLDFILNNWDSTCSCRVTMNFFVHSAYESYIVQDNTFLK